MFTSSRPTSPTITSSNMAKRTASEILIDALCVTSSSSDSSCDDTPGSTSDNCAAAEIKLSLADENLTIKNKDTSCVNVDKKNCSPYTQDPKIEELVEKIAALTLESLPDEELEWLNKELDVTTEDTSLIIERIPDIVKDYPNGLSEANLEESYTEKYNEKLPEDWLKFVLKVVTFDIGTNDTLFLCPQKTSVDSSRSPSPCEIDVPQTLNLSHLNEFWFHVYAAYSTTKIWGIIIDEDHSDKIEELAEKMQVYYDNDICPTTSVTPGKYYAVFDSAWHRVRCLEYYKEDDSASVRFIDRGDEDILPASILHELQSKFCELPEQAVCVSLIGLEFFEDCDEVQPILEDLLVEKDVLVKNEYFDPSVIKKNPNILSVDLFFDKDGEELNVNKLIKKKILKVVDPFYFISPVKVFQQVHISHISEKAIFVQLKFKGLEIFQKLIDNVSKELDIYSKSQSILKFDTSKIYATRSTADNLWYRVKLSIIANDNLALAFCIDIGQTVTVQKNNLVLLEDVSELLTLYPPQAVQIKLHKIPSTMFDKKMACQLFQLTSKSEVIYMKIIQTSKDGPDVMLFKRSKNNQLTSLNETLLSTYENYYSNLLQIQNLNITKDEHGVQSTTWLENDPRLHLYCYTKQKKLSKPIYQHLQLKNQSIIAVVTVDNKQYNSYPKESTLKDDAEKIAANHALQDLLGKKFNTSFADFSKQDVSLVQKFINPQTNHMDDTNQSFSKILNFQSNQTNVPSQAFSNFLNLQSNQTNITNQTVSNFFNSQSNQTNVTSQDFSNCLNPQSNQIDVNKVFSDYYFNNWLPVYNYNMQCLNYYSNWVQSYRQNYNK